MNIKSASVLAALLLPGVVRASDEYVWSSFSAGVSYPLAVAVGGGVKITNDPFTSPALKLNGQAGIGGGLISAGVSMPVRQALVLSVEAAVLRTWLLEWEPRNENYRGLLATVDVVGHMSLKGGLGYFEETSGRQDEVIYGFVGLGW